MKKSFDVVVIGTGEAASAAAWKVHAAGRRTAVIDWRPFGGTCALRGCDPKKVLVGAAETLDRLQRMDKKGVHAQAARIDWPALMRFKRTFTRPVPEAREKEFLQAGIAALHGQARFVGSRKLRVDSEEIEADHFVIASGARPVTLRFPGAEHLITSEQFLELDELPRRIVFKLDSRVERVERGSAGSTVHASGGVQVKADLVVHGAGRVPDIDEL